MLIDKPEGRKKKLKSLERTDITGQPSLPSSHMIIDIYIRLCVCACARLPPPATICLAARNERWRSSPEERPTEHAQRRPRGLAVRAPLVAPGR